MLANALEVLSNAEAAKEKNPLDLDLDGWCCDWGRAGRSPAWFFWGEVVALPLEFVGRSGLRSTLSDRAGCGRAFI